MYRGNLNNIKEVQRLNLFFHILISFVFIFIFSSFFSLADVFFHFQTFFRIVIIALIFFSWIYFLFKKIKSIESETLLQLDKEFQNLKNKKLWHHSKLFNRKLKYSPRVLYDVEKNNISNFTNDNKNSIESIEYKEWRNHFLYENNFSYFPGIQKYTKRIKQKFTKFIFLIFVILIFFSFLNFFLSVQPFRIFSFNQSVVVSESVYSLSPKGGEFFYAEPLSIQLKLKDKDYMFLYFETASIDKNNDVNQKIFQKTKEIIVKKNSNYTLKINALVENFQLRAVFLRGVEKFYSKIYKYKMISPEYFKQITFKITPPAYVKQKPYITKDNMMKVYYGSKIQSSIVLNKKGSVYYHNQKLNEVTNDSAIYNHTFFFHSLIQQKIQYKIKSKSNDSVIEIKSPEYEIWANEDSVPIVKISQKKKVNLLQLSEKGSITFFFNVQDDFGIQKVFADIVVDDRLKKRIFIPLNQLDKKKLNQKIYYSGKVKILLENIKEDMLDVFLVAIDNSLIPSVLPWKEKTYVIKSKKNKYISKKYIGQIGVSAKLSIEFPRDSKTKEKWQKKEDDKILTELIEKQEQYRQSDKELKNILERARAGENKQNLSKEIKTWAQKRKELQKSMRGLHNKLKKNLKNNSSVSAYRKKKILKNTENALKEDIQKKEKELQNLMKHFPKSFDQASSQIKKMTQKQYLKNLDNSIKQMKKMLAIQKISKLKRKLDTLIQKHRRLQDKVAFSKQSDKEKSQSIEESKKLKKEFDQIKKSAQKIKKELKDLMLNKEFDLSPSKQSEEQFKEKMEALKENLMKKNKSSAIKNMSQSEKALLEWKKKIDKEYKKLGAKELEKYLKAFKKAAFELNTIAGVLKKRIEKEFQYDNKADKNKLRKYGSDISALKNSYRASLLKLKKIIQRGGELNPAVMQKLQAIDNNFKKIRYDIENNMFYSVKNDSRTLLWKLNRGSLYLLKEMGKMRSSMAMMSQGQMKSSMQQAGKMQKELQKLLQKMGKQQQGKSQSLSKSEKEYLNSLAQRQKELEERLKELAKRKELEGSSVSKEAKKLAKEIAKLKSEIKKSSSRKQLNVIAKKLNELSKKFLNSQKSIKRRHEISKKREAVKSLKEYIIQPEKEKSIIKKSLPYKPDLSEYSMIQRLFYKNYIRNLEEEK